MKDAFEPLAGSGVGKYAAGEFVAAQAAIRPDGFGAKGGDNLREGGLPGLDDLARQVIGVHHTDAAVLEELGRSGLAHADTTG